MLNSEPDWSRLPPGTPPAIRRLLRRCLQKDPARRLRHAGDATLDIDEAQAGVAVADDVVQPLQRRWQRFGVSVALILASMAAVATALALRSGTGTKGAV